MFMVNLLDFVIFIVLTALVLMISGKNSSPEFLTKILYNNDFKESSEEGDNSAESSKGFKKTSKKNSKKNPSNKKSSKAKKAKEERAEELDSVLDYSSEYELEDFDPSEDASKLINDIMRK